jgi:hypothetical protein
MKIFNKIVMMIGNMVFSVDIKACVDETNLEMENNYPD